MVETVPEVKAKRWGSFFILTLNVLPLPHVWLHLTPLRWTYWLFNKAELLISSNACHLTGKWEARYRRWGHKGIAISIANDPGLIQRLASLGTEDVVSVTIWASGVKAIVHADSYLSGKKEKIDDLVKYVAATTCKVYLKK